MDIQGKLHVICTGVLGSASSFAALAASFQEELKWSLQIASLIVGIIVGILTALSLIRNLRSKK